MEEDYEDTANEYEDYADDDVFTRSVTQDCGESDKHLRRTGTRYAELNIDSCEHCVLKQVQTYNFCTFCTLYPCVCSVFNC